jgi:transposase-like protein
LLAHSGKVGRRVVSAFIATAFAQDDAEAAKAQWRKVADQLRPKVPKLAALMDEAETDVLAYMTFPKDHRQKIRSTNPSEPMQEEGIHEQWLGLVKRLSMSRIVARRMKAAGVVAKRSKSRARWHSS